MTEQPITQFSNSSTLTDICCRADNAEVELVSLLEEHIPHYKLRADTLTEFCGYENEDWYIQTPVLSPDTDIPLSPEVVEETLKYFVLCADRLSQMTKTYNDIDAVTRLLEEKERDLELAARIGQSLLDQNKDLRSRNDLLEQELSTSSETIIQLKHDLSVKNGLLQIYTQDLDTDSESGSPSSRERGFSVSWDTLNKKISCLQEENNLLRAEAVSRTTDIEEEEKKEMQLISDCVRQLTEANKQLTILQEEVGRKSEDSIRQQEEITQLLSQIVDLQRKLRDVTADNECLTSKLEIAEECQHELSEELIDMKEKYGELMAAFQELQAEAKQAQRNKLPSANTWQNFGMFSPYINPDSLASELEQSLGGRDSDGYSSDERPSHSRKVFNTVRYANHGVPARNRFSSSRSHYTMSGTGGRPSLTSTCFSSLSQLSSLSSGFNDLASDTESAYAESYSTDDENPDTFVDGKTERMRPNKLDVGLHSFSSGFGTATDLNTELGKAAGDSWTRKSLYGRTIRRYQFPEKLQIIKPLEGSQTLHHWQRLATPHLGGIFESRPGVKIRGETKLQDFDEKVSLGDFEEDDDFSNPGKSFMDTSSIYTFTTSALKTSEMTNVTPSYPHVQLSTRITSIPPSTLNSPQQKGSGYSLTGQSLAKLLTERGIHAMVPSAISSSVKSVSPTPTPAPSPEGSPPSSPLPFTAVRIPDLVGSASIAKGYHLFRKPRRSRSQPPPKRSTREASAGLNLDLMESIQGIGLKTLIPTTECSLNKRTVSTETLTSDSSTVTISSRLEAATKRQDSSKTVSFPTSISGQEEVSRKTVSPETLLDKPWGYVPPSVSIVKSPAAIGLTPTVAPPLSRMPNPVLQLNSLRSIRPNCADVGTVGTLRTLRKGGYI
ncbi:trafficking kinesin-binding protein 1-like isoform X1 [Argiope bruennichi]|uniref:trafficking kinesin-binding protein 1-like isoform X1 n=1 Tax=Argiope bruennichi TaxID=94029 RepID=UPI00249588F5|nr:trafficking kinesin-binding protein 1-like isoform X1 [Argiope bruennichi]XP_055946891.1 trafficking kinesin-binding protein 1-like isoform X1 [Argiope bruennichi]XP_055946899.1 trafficking kinesin-binding protein 1-like isoform X1 [Argiope bruennichi]